MRILSVAAALVAALTFAACGSDSDSDSSGEKPADVLAAAIAKSTSAESYRAKISAKVQDQETISVDGELTSSADSKTSFGKVKFVQGSKPATDLKLLTVDGKQYIQAPGITGELPAGKRWLQSEETATGSLTPKQFMDLLRKSDDIENRGNETVGGTETVHLGGPLDLEKVVAETDNASLKKQLGSIPSDKLDTTIDVWVDAGADQIKKMSLAMKYDGKDLLTSDAEMLEYGVSLDSIKAPPADQVVMRGS